MSRRYDRRHEAIRRTLLAEAYGEPCHICGRTMVEGQPLDLDHTADGSGYRGMAHASCNRREGQRRGMLSRRPRGGVFA